MKHKREHTKGITVLLSLAMLISIMGTTVSAMGTEGAVSGKMVTEQEVPPSSATPSDAEYSKIESDELEMGETELLPEKTESSLDERETETEDAVSGDGLSVSTSSNAQQEGELGTVTPSNAAMLAASDTVMEDGLIYVLDEMNLTAEITGHTLSAETTFLNIPSTITVEDVKYNVTSIADRVFENFGEDGNTIMINLGSNLQKIGAYAFSNAGIDKGTFTIPDSVTEIGEYAFAGMKTDMLTIGAGLTVLSKGVFANLQGFNGGGKITVILGENLTEIASDAFTQGGTIKKLTVYGSEDLIKDCNMLKNAEKIEYIEHTENNR